MGLKRANSLGVAKKDRTEYRRSSSDIGDKSKAAEPHSPKREVSEDGSYGGSESPNDVMQLNPSGQSRKVLDTALVLYEGGMPEPPMKFEPEIDESPRRRPRSRESKRTFRRCNSVGKDHQVGKKFLADTEKKNKHESKAKSDSKDAAKTRGGRSCVASVLKSRSKSIPARQTETKAEKKNEKTEKKESKAAKTAPPKRMNSANAAPSTLNRYELPWNTATGNCTRHPDVHLAEKNGSRWKIVREECPKCAKH